MKVLNAEQTRNLEKNAVRSGISYLQLMEKRRRGRRALYQEAFPG